MKRRRRSSGRSSRARGSSWPAYAISTARSTRKLPTRCACSLAGPGSWATGKRLLDRDVVDAVIVARSRDDDRRAEQLRKLIQVGMPFVASHPVVDSMLIYYELDMIRRETDCVAVPYLPARHHPAVQSLAEMVSQGADSPIGRVEQIVFQRRIARTDKAGIVAQFARDVDVIRAVAGDMTRLGAMAAAHGSYARPGRAHVGAVGRGRAVERRFGARPAGGAAQPAGHARQGGGRLAIRRPAVVDGSQRGRQNRDPAISRLESAGGGSGRAGFGAGRRPRRSPVGSTPRERSSWPKRSTAAWPRDARSSSTTKTTPRRGRSRAR